MRVYCYSNKLRAGRAEKDSVSRIIYDTDTYQAEDASPGAGVAEPLDARVAVESRLAAPLPRRACGVVVHELYCTNSRKHKVPE
jgi:hypothetical protein